MSDPVSAKYIEAIDPLKYAYGFTPLGTPKMSLYIYDEYAISINYGKVRMNDGTVYRAVFYTSHSKYYFYDDGDRLKFTRDLVDVMLPELSMFRPKFR